MAAAMASPAAVAGSGLFVIPRELEDEAALMLNDQSVGGTSSRE